MMKKLLLLIVAAVVSMSASTRAHEDRVLRAELMLPAPVKTVWELWTTEAGVRSFFAQGAHIEPKVDGLYEILFSPEAAAGKRGAEGLRILAMESEKRFVFTWNAPETLPTIRAQRTVVEIRFEPVANGTRLTFTHSGWGTGADWDAAYDYFDKAWGGFVLPSLVSRVEKGPISWSQSPTLKPMGSMKVGLTEPKSRD